VSARGWELPTTEGSRQPIGGYGKRTHAKEEVHTIAARLVKDINDWRTHILRAEQGLGELPRNLVDTHYKKFFMLTIRGSDVGRKKRYAGLSVEAAGKVEMVYRGLEMARSDRTRSRVGSRKDCCHESSTASLMKSSWPNTRSRRWLARRMTFSSTADCRLPIADVVVQPFGGENLMAITIS